ATGEAGRHAYLGGELLAQYGQHRLHHPHRFVRRHPQPAHEAVLDAPGVQRRRDVRATAVHQHGRYLPRQLPHARGNCRTRGGVCHGVPAVLDDQAHGAESTTARDRFTAPSEAVETACRSPSGPTVGVTSLPTVSPSRTCGAPPRRTQNTCWPTAADLRWWATTPASWPASSRCRRQACSPPAGWKRA